MLVKLNPKIEINPSTLKKLRPDINALRALKNKSQNNFAATAGIGALAASGAVISSFYKDFNNTIEKDNYFQLKLDPNTGKPYQADVFQKASAVNLYLGNDVTVTAPTGTGKTAIAQYVITKNLKEGKRTFYTTPLKALSNEKYREFCKTYGEKNVGVLTGDTKINPNAPIVIMTTEVYRNMTSAKLFNPSYDEEIGGLKGLRTVIFDELQYLGDVDRGGIWEQSIMFTPKNVQILSLSATIGNNHDINSWIASTKGKEDVAITPYKNYVPNKSTVGKTVLINVPSENRHVPLTFEIENVAAEIKIPQTGTKADKIRAKKKGAEMAQSIFAIPKEESYKKLTEKLYKEDKVPAIYFVFSKKVCRNLLRYLSEEGPALTTTEEQKEISKIIEQHRADGAYLGESLNVNALMQGYAIHNAGLLPSQKCLVEELFQKKLVKVVLATETLSAGINMPAKTTVISCPRKPSSTPDGGKDNKRNLTPNEFHQMAGRAGRRGIDTHGYCYVLSCNPEQKKLYQNLIAAPSNKLESNLELDYAFITNYLSKNIDEMNLRKTLTKSLFVYNSKSKVDKGKLGKLLDNFYLKRNILYQNGFINENGATLKGELIKLLSGYEQIPTINLVANKTFAGLNPVQIAGIAGGIANIEYNTISDSSKSKKTSDVIMQEDKEFVDASRKVMKQINKYQTSYQKLYPEKELFLETKAMDQLYAWADLNSNENNSRKNWRKLYKDSLKYSIRDEGTLFKQITKTSDLLKQLINVADAGAKNARTEDDRNYYSELKPKLREALKLIQREPTDGN